MSEQDKTRVAVRAGAWAGVSDFGAGPLLVQYIPGDTIANIISALSSFSKYCRAWCGTW